MPVEKIKLSDIKIGPIYHQTLPAELLARIEAFKKILSDVEPTSLEATTDNFKRDMHPEREVAIWEEIANAYQAFINSHSIIDCDTRRDVFDTLLGISTGEDDFSNIHTLTNDQICELKDKFSKQTHP